MHTLVSDDVFDAAFARIRTAGVPFRADPFHQHPVRINHDHRGRDVYFDDPTATAWNFRPRPTARPSSNDARPERREISISRRPRRGRRTPCDSA
jgi:hypothetical protein